VLRPGSLGHVPRNTEHSFKVTSKAVCHVLNYYTPAGFEQAIIGSARIADRRELPPTGMDPSIRRRSRGSLTTTGSLPPICRGQSRSSIVRSSFWAATSDRSARAVPTRTLVASNSLAWCASTPR
jgi:hypothetical protein